MSKKKKNKKKKKVRFDPKPSVSGNTQKESKISFFFKKLYSNDSAGLYQLVTVAPFFIASWVAGGFIISRMTEFFIVTLVMIVGSYTGELEKNKKLSYKKEFKIISTAILVALIFWFSSVTSHLALTLLLAVTVLIQRLSEYIDFSNVKNIILKCSGMIIRMSLYSLIGIVSQRYVENPEIQWQYVVFGFVPGTLLAGSLIARKSQVFINSSWSRFSEGKNKKGEAVKRPAGLTRLLSMFLILGPALPTILTPFDIFPTPFLFTAVAFYFVPNILEDYLNESQADAVIAMRTANLALAMSALVLLIGIFVRFGVV